MASENAVATSPHHYETEIDAAVAAAVAHRWRIPSTVGRDGEQEYAVASSTQQTKPA